MSCKVQVSLQYVQRCTHCLANVNRILSDALVNTQVTRISIQPVARCEHESAEDLTKRLRETPTVQVAARQPAPLGGQSVLVQMPASSPYESQGEVG